MTYNGLITQVDLNFSNSSSIEKTANISAVYSDDAYDFGDVNIPPNAVVGELSGSITLKDTGLQELLKNFTITEVSVSQDAVNRSLEFKMQDDLSLDLDSTLALVRGRELGPMGELDFSGYIYNWTELPDEIKWASGIVQDFDGIVGNDVDFNSYGKQDPEYLPDERILKIGDIYNIVQLEDVKGESWTKVYQNQERKYFLEVKPENDVFFINYEWPTLADPEEDRGSWQDSTIKLGFTLGDLRSGLDAIPIAHSGIPDENEFLMEEGGDLTDLISLAATKLGYYWFTDPIEKKIIWIDSENIDTLVVSNNVDTTDPDIISATFTESIKQDAKFISYNTTKKDEAREQPQRTQKERKIQKPFKLLRFNDEIDTVLEYLFGIYYLMWNKDLLSEDYFKKLWFFAMHYSSDFRLAISKIEYDDLLLEELGDTPWDLKQQIEDLEQMPDAEKDTPAGLAKELAGELAREFVSIFKEDERHVPAFRYAYPLEKTGNSSSKSVADPVELGLYGLVTTFMDAGLGGLYMSGPVSDYRKDRIIWDQQEGFRIVGPFAAEEYLDEIPEFQSIAKFLRLFDKSSRVYDQIHDLHKAFYPNWNADNYKEKYYFFAYKEINKKFLNEESNDVVLAFGERNGMRIIEENKSNLLYLLSSTSGLSGADNLAVEYVNKSRDLFDARRDELVIDDVITIPYRRTRHPITSEEYKETEDNFVPTIDNYGDLDTNRQKRRILLDYPDETLSNLNPMKLEVYTAEGNDELQAIRRNKKNKLEEVLRKSSTTTYNKLFVPTFSPTLSNLTISYGSNGVTTTVTESTLQIIPQDISFVISKDNTVKRNDSLFTRSTARKRNALGL